MNLSNELKKRDKMLGLQSILSLFHNEFDKFNNTGAQMLDSFYHMALKLHKTTHFWRENAIYFRLLCNVKIGVIS